eukprot:4523531-Amphidinium_carterae.1
MADLKRVGRYLHSHRCLVNVFKRQIWPCKVAVEVDTDFKRSLSSHFGGDQTSRRSTTGVATFL